MRVIRHKKELHELLGLLRSKGDKIGFVPTMGTFHEGHLSLLRCCRKENNISVVSIFVNPTQFNDKNDFKNYPRDLNKDLQVIEPENPDFVFCPETDEMYPEPDKRVFDFGKLGNVMEGEFRPGHFNGVAQIVTKLFDIVMPNNAYFGEKDFQQLAIITFMVRSLNLPINIVSCPIIRETDGLAMSSRNQLLNPEERKSAALIFQTLSKAVNLQKQHKINELINWVFEQIDSNPLLKVEYFKIVDSIELQPVNNWEAQCNKVGCIAVKAGKIRLIDNIRFNS